MCLQTIIGHWESLSTMSENRKKALSDSHEVQKFIRFVMILIDTPYPVM